MSVYTIDWNEPPPEGARGGALSIGNFDGVHLGHAALAAELRRQARGLGGPGTVLTFDPHPLKLLRPDLFQPVLTSAADRASLLHAAGADHVLLVRTTTDLLQLTAEDFYGQIICERLQAQVIVEGRNFGFGRGRAGNVDTLMRLGEPSGRRVIVVPPVLFDEKPVSSSRVRNALVDGDVREAIQLLSRPYRVSGTVGVGRRRGQVLGFPTANLEKVETLLPGDGVYAVRVHLQTGSWPGAANIGPNPTFGEQARKVEVHLIGFQGVLVGQVLEVDFLERLRETKPFPTVDRLVEQLRLDVEQAANIAGTPMTQR
jgi:riboflavin kinase/FMN adenylyltransferase